MQDLKTILAGAVGEGVIAADQAAPLETFLSARGVVVRTASADDARPDLAEDAAFETEAPRFVRGFHDVLITIGIVIVLTGIWGMGSFLAALPAIVVLAEVLVRRQRLALPAVALTVAFVQWIAVVAGLAVDEFDPSASSLLHVLLYLVPFPILLAAFTWRYRVPLSLAMFWMSVAVFSLAGVFYLLELALGVPDIIRAYPLLTSIVLLTAALSLFALAMRFDLSDPARRSRSSDVAFWLHLAAAPALLYAMLSFVFLDNVSGFDPFPTTADSADAVLVVLIVLVFMTLGLIIDRRAFVTSGLLSLGFAIYRLFEQMNAKLDVYAFVTLLIVGLVVLTIGVGWPWFRRTVVSGLPLPLQAKLPPLR